MKRLSSRRGFGLMRDLRLLWLSLAVVCGFTLTCAAESNPDWTTPLAPFQIADNLYYVGSRDLAAYLVTTPAGNILINANIASSPPLLRRSVETLGFRWADMKIVLNGQAHSDHVGGLAEVLRETHAQDMVMEYDAELVRDGGSTDFAHTTDGLVSFAPARVDRVLHDGDTVELGGVRLTAHRTGGHTRGCTTWTFRTHMPGDPAGRLRDVVLVGGMAPLSGYRLVDTPARRASYPGIAEDFTHTFALLRALPCDLFLGAHGQYFGMLAKLEAMPQRGPSVFVDPAGYHAAIDHAEANFKAMLARQRSSRSRR